jgi:dihydrofolate reductase
VNAAIALIAAVAQNGVIGSGGEIPWRLPSDFAFFKRITLGKPVIMGRKTFESIGRPLPGRTNLVVTTRPGYQPEGVEVVPSLEAALDRAREITTRDGAEELMVIGGGEVYRAVIGRADRLYITHVAVSPEGDARFPEIDPGVWQVDRTLDIARTDKDSAAFAVKVYTRRGLSAR